MVELPAPVWNQIAQSLPLQTKEAEQAFQMTGKQMMQMEDHGEVCGDIRERVLLDVRDGSADANVLRIAQRLP